MKLLLALAFFAHCQAVPWIPELRGDDYWWERHRIFVENTARNANNISAIFYGDSITEAWGGPGKAIFDSKFAPVGTVNYGIGSDRTENLLFRIADLEVQGLNPKVVVLKIGTNNWEDSVDDVSRGIKAVVDLLLQLLPNTKVLLLGVLPRNDADWFTRVADINIKISKFHDGNKIYFLDMWHHFATAFGVCDQLLYSGDQLHLETPGYQEWANTMDELFNELLSSN